MLGNVAKPVLDLLFPPLCIGCRASVGEAGFCADCWSSITFLDGSGCACCGIPFPVALEGDNLCAACLAKPPAFDSARAIMAYDDKSRGAILALKHAARLDLVPGFARWLGRALARDWRLAFDPVLVRSRATPSQGAMTSAKARRRNVQRAFEVPDPARATGKTVLLLDDVMTTGSTVEACARPLKRAGAHRVDVLVLARVVKALDVLI
jgi:predicted amidophosphoribosyltransferase